MQIHHTGQGRRESHAVYNRAVTGQSNEFVALGDHVQKAAINLVKRYVTAELKGDEIK